MQELEKILEEIESEFDRRINTQLKIMAGLEDDVYRYGYGKSLEAYQQGKLLTEDIIRKHMNGGERFEFDFTNVKSFDCQCGRHYVNTGVARNDDWIPVDNKYSLPQGNEHDFGFWITIQYKNGYRRTLKATWNYFDKCFMHQNGRKVSEDVVAYKYYSLPEANRPEEKN